MNAISGQSWFPYVAAAVIWAGIGGYAWLGGRWLERDSDRRLDRERDAAS